MPVIDYREWLELNEQERAALHQGWDTYAREGYGVVLNALARLVMQIGDVVWHAEVELGHCGEYIIGITLFSSKKDAVSVSELSEFEGFRVTWREFSDAGPPLAE